MFTFHYLLVDMFILVLEYKLKRILNEGKKGKRQE